MRGHDHALTKTLRQAIDAHAMNKINNHMLFSTVHGIAQGLLSDMEAGLVPDLRSRIRSEVEGDFLEQAQRLLDENRKDPAAMLVGAVLEDALRQLCRKHGLAEANSIDPMNTALRKADVYSEPRRAAVAAWAAVRNKAAHGRFTDYTDTEVRQMHQGVADFVATFLEGSKP